MYISYEVEKTIFENKNFWKKVVLWFVMSTKRSRKVAEKSTLDFKNVEEIFNLNMDDSTKLSTIEKLFRENEIELPEKTQKKTDKYKEHLDSRSLPILEELKESFDEIEECKKSRSVVEYNNLMAQISSFQKELRKLRRDETILKLKKVEEKQKEVIEKLKKVEETGKKFALKHHLNPLSFEIQIPKTLEEIEQILETYSSGDEEQNEEDEKEDEERPLKTAKNE